MYVCMYHLDILDNIGNAPYFYNCNTFLMMMEHKSFMCPA